MEPLATPTPEERRDASRRLRRGLSISIGFAACLWWIHILAESVQLNFRGLGIRPGEPEGLVGIVFAPLIHGDWGHLAANTPALLILGTLLVYSYPRSWYWLVPLVWVSSGLGVWLFGRPAVHFGASGLTHGLMFYLFVIGVLRRDRRAMAVAMAVFFLYGSMLVTIFPTAPEISWEAHFFGAAGGLLGVLLLRHRDPLPRIRIYSWETADADEKDPLIGDLWKMEHDSEPLDDEATPPAGQHSDKLH